MRDSYTIRLADPAHLASIPGIEQAAAGTFPVQDLPLHLRYQVTDRDTLRLAQQDGRLWVALDGLRHPVGFAMVEVADDQAYLSEMDVHPDHGRLGLGTRLVRAAVDWAVSQGYESVLLVTFRHLPWNAPFYAKLGFTQLEQSELGPELRGFIEEEAAAGIDPANRVGMRMILRHQRQPTLS